MEAPLRLAAASRRHPPARHARHSHHARHARRALTAALGAVALGAAAVMAVLGAATLLSGGTSAAWVPPPAASRRGAAAAAAAALLAQGGARPAAAEEKKNLGFVPAEYVAKEAGQKITTPNGLVYEALEIGEPGTGNRIGPPRSGSVVWVKYTGHVDSFDGPVFDSSAIRGSRKANKPDYIEIRLNLEPSITNGLVEALKLMKVGGKGRFEQPPILSYSEGKVGFDPDEDCTAKGKIPPESTLYYDVELVRIVKP